MVEGNRPSKGNLMRVLGLILKELQQINQGIKKLNGVDDAVIEKKDADRFRNQSREFRKG